jgi:hypothetical protein
MKDLFNTPAVRLFLVFFFSALLISLTTYANDSYGLIYTGKALIYVVCVISTIAYATLMGVIDARTIITEHWTRVAYRFFLLTIFPGILAIQRTSYVPLTLAFMNYTLFYFAFELVYEHEKKGNPFSVGTTAWNDRAVNWLNANTFLGKIFPAWYIDLKMSLILTAQVLVIKYFL